MGPPWSPRANRSAKYMSQRLNQELSVVMYTRAHATHHDVSQLSSPAHVVQCIQCSTVACISSCSTVVQCSTVYTHAQQLVSSSAHVSVLQYTLTWADELLHATVYMTLHDCIYCIVHHHQLISSLALTLNISSLVVVSASELMSCCCWNCILLYYCMLLYYCILLWLVLHSCWSWSSYCWVPWCDWRRTLSA